MYFAKARKQMEEQDMQEVQEKLEKYQRSDTARVLQQAKSSRTEDSSSSSSSRQTRDEFRPEELPDGAFVSPKHTPSHSASVSKSDPATFSSPAEYIGSFSVTGTDEDARARVVETQLQALRSVTKSKKVILIISLDGVKVYSSDLQTLYMLHELKRIAYATCDPEHCQFSFLAREPKGQMNLQYCHVFSTQTPDQATELNTIIGNAFKMAYAQQRERQPTFHELIEAQVAEQRAKFLEIEKQAQAELQRKLAEIARPTPFSQQAIQRMEQRRQAQEELNAEPDVPAGKQRVWAKQAVDKVQHRFSLHEVSIPVSGSQQMPSRHSEPHALPSASSDKSAKSAGGVKSYVHKNITKHNSAPLFPAQVSSPSDEPPAQGEQVSCVIPHHPLSAQAIRVSIEAKKDSKFKGSPVTVLKNEIDRRFLSNGSETQPVEPTSSAAASLCLEASERETDQKAIRHEQVRHQIQMANRPLPSVPPSFSPPHAARVSGSSSSSNVGSSSNNSNNSNNSSKVTPRQRPSSSYQWRSADDHSCLPTSSSSPAPLSSPLSSPRPNNGVHIRGSPHRKQPRPLSEIATGSAGGASGARVFESRVLEARYHHHYSSYEVTASASSSSSSPSSHHHFQYSTSVQATAAPSTPPPAPSSPSAEGELYVYGPSPGGVVAEMRAGGKGPRFEASPRAGGQEKVGLSRASGCPSGNTEVVLRYQNDSPFLSEDPADVTDKSRQGLESLMCLDRSHIEDPTLRQAPWYQAGIPREIALEILSQEEVGSFIVRDSTTHPGCFALSVRVPKFENSSGISHYLILKTHRGVRLKGLDKEWPNLTALVTHHTVMPEMLPCTLRLPRNNKNLTFRQTERDEAEDDEDDDDANYQRLAEVTALAGQLKL